MARPLLWVTERDRQIWIARACGDSFASIGAHFGVSAGRAWEVDRNVQRRIECRWRILLTGVRR